MSVISTPQSYQQTPGSTMVPCQQAHELSNFLHTLDSLYQLVCLVYSEVSPVRVLLLTKSYVSTPASKSGETPTAKLSQPLKAVCVVQALFRKEGKKNLKIASLHRPLTGDSQSMRTDWTRTFKSSDVCRYNLSNDTSYIKYKILIDI